MSAREILDALVVWTPFLAEGFLWNVAISLASMAIGTPLGIALAHARAARGGGVRAGGRGMTVVARNVPTFVMLFYFALILPPSITLGGTEIPFPAWTKAALALGIAVAGFVSDTWLIALQHWRRGERTEALLFLPAWTTYFVIIVMASSTASVIGVPELVQRTNTVISATGERDMMVWLWLYAMLWFMAFCWPTTAAMAVVRRRLERRQTVAGDPVGRDAVADPETGAVR
jgi:polar amino acid transport system permease protein